MFDDSQMFDEQKREQLNLRLQNEKLSAKALELQIELDKYKYGYSFNWCGVPIIRLPDDIVIFQELVWDQDPDIIVEIGVARGGSVLLSSSLLHLLGKNGRVIGMDIDIREHNRKKIENHRLSENITLIEEDSISENGFIALRDSLDGTEIDILVLDSNHTHDHVYHELNLYSKLVKLGGYIVLPDTVIEKFPENYYLGQREWNVGNNPMTAIFQFLGENSNFQIDMTLSSKGVISESPNGYLKRVG